MTFATELFRIITDADADSVWDTLAPVSTGCSYLYGMAVECDWTPGSPINVGPAGRPGLAGVVLVADRPRRLSYTLGDTTREPSVYVTWELRADPAGTVVRLYVDELDPDPDTAAELESVWLPVLSELQLDLERGVRRGHATTAGD
jgi:hypothetical protein